MIVKELACSQETLEVGVLAVSDIHADAREWMCLQWLVYSQRLGMEVMYKRVLAS